MCLGSNVIFRSFACLSAQRHYNLLDARIVAKSNSKSNDHPDSHYCFAQVNNVLEVITATEGEIGGFSLDDKVFEIACFMRVAAAS